MEQLHAQGNNVPAIDQRPKLYSDLWLTWEFFWELNQTRDIDGMTGSFRPIKYSEILSLMALYQITSYQSKILILKRMRIMDECYLKTMSKKGK